MTADLLLALVGFALVTSITPGPNNTMLLASGVNFGFRRSLPHMAGICAGCALMLPLVGLGLGGLFAAMPALYVALRYAGAAYLLVLAWKIATSGTPKPDGAAARPFGFMQALGFQFVNPKAWIMMVGAVTTYTPHGSYLHNLMIVTAVFALVMLPSIAIWAGCGVAMRRLLSNPARVRAFNITMALLLVASLYPLMSGIE